MFVFTEVAAVKAEAESAQRRRGVPLELSSCVVLCGQNCRARQGSPLTYGKKCGGLREAAEIPDTRVLRPVTARVPLKLSSRSVDLTNGEAPRIRDLRPPADALGGVSAGECKASSITSIRYPMRE